MLKNIAEKAVLHVFGLRSMYDIVNDLTSTFLTFCVFFMILQSEMWKLRDLTTTFLGGGKKANPNTLSFFFFWL